MFTVILRLNNIRRRIEACAPQPVAQYNLLPVSRYLRIPIELASKLRFQSKHTKISRRNSEASQLHRLT